jgi:GT2 family glycosyltransferase
MAGACVFRADVFRQTGGYEPRLFIGGEETLVSLDVLRAGHGIVYMDELVLHHHPSPLRDSAQRRRLLARNAAWVAWMRLPLAEALCATRAAIAVLPALPDLKELIAGIAWALRRRRVIDKHVQRFCCSKAVRYDVRNNMTG